MSSDQEGPYRKILVGYDGSDNAQRALEKAIELAKESHGELKIILVENLAGMMSVQGVTNNEEFVNRALAAGKALVDGAVQQAKAAGVENAEASVEEGPVVAILLDEENTSDFKPDLLVVGRRGATGFKRLLIGSVSSAVVAHSRCDVLVVR